MTNRTTTTTTTLMTDVQSLQPRTSDAVDYFTVEYHRPTTYTRHFPVQPDAFTKKPVYHKQVRHSNNDVRVFV